jgi:hypothetical protein
MSAETKMIISDAKRLNLWVKPYKKTSSYGTRKGYRISGSLTNLYELINIERHYAQLCIGVHKSDYVIETKEEQSK